MSCCSSLGPLLSSLGGCRAHLDSGPGPGLTPGLMLCSVPVWRGLFDIHFSLGPKLWAPRVGSPGWLSLLGSQGRQFSWR